jgi:signal peptidase II
LRRLGELLLLPFVALAILAADQVTKSLVVAHLQPGQSIELAPWLTPVFVVTRVSNTGVAFGLFQGMSDILAVVTLFVVGMLLLYYRHLPPGQPLLRVALGFQLGGATGNLIDRLLRGLVVDFIDLNFWPMKNWPVSNVADICIVTGVILLALLVVWEQWQETRRQKALSVEEAG